MSSKVAAMDKKLDKVDLDVMSDGYPYGWTFLGHGCYETEDDHLFKGYPSLKLCYSMCNLKRQTDGTSWNGIIWDFTEHACWCEKNDRGHKTAGYQHLLHFRIE